MGTRPIGFQENSTLPMPTRPPLLGEEHGQVGLVVGEPDPRLYELSHAVGAVGATAFRLVRPHGDDGVDCPFPVILRTGRVLDADRPNLDLVTIVFQNDAVALGGLPAVFDLAEIEVHPFTYPLLQNPDLRPVPMNSRNGRGRYTPAATASAEFPQRLLRAFLIP